jgi:hypothetical protein
MHEANELSSTLRRPESSPSWGRRRQGEGRDTGSGVPLVDPPDPWRKT